KASYNGTDNLYRLNPIEKSISQITNISYGAFNPAYDSHSNTLLFNNYQPYGYQISQLKLGEVTSQALDSIENTFISYFEPLLAQESKPIDLDSLEQAEHASTPYKEL